MSLTLFSASKNIDKKKLNPHKEDEKHEMYSLFFFTSFFLNLWMFFFIVTSNDQAN